MPQLKATFELIIKVIPATVVATAVAKTLVTEAAMAAAQVVMEGRTTAVEDIKAVFQKRLFYKVCCFK